MRISILCLLLSLTAVFRPVAAGSGITNGDEARQSPPGTSDDSSGVETLRCMPVNDKGSQRNLVVHTRLRVLPAMPSQSPTERPYSTNLAVLPVIAGKPTSNSAMYFQTDEVGACALRLPPGRYWIGPPERISPGGTLSNRPPNSASSLFVEAKVVTVDEQQQQITLYAIAALP